MQSEHPLCSALRSDVVEHLGPIQQSFDAYQKAAFIVRPAEFFALELCGEAGELANLEKKVWKGLDIDHDHLSDEAADVLIALVNYCNARGVDLAEAVSAKLVRIKPSLST